MLSLVASRSAPGARAALSTSAAMPQRALPLVWSRGMAKGNKNSRFQGPPPAQKKPSNAPPTQNNKPQQPKPTPPTQSTTQSTNKIQNPSKTQSPNKAQSPTPKQTPKPTPTPTPTPSTNDASSKPAPPSDADADPVPDLSQLPDLTQGIPSTFEYEQAQRSRSSLEPVDEAETATSGGGGRAKGELPASAYVSSADRRRKKVMMGLYAALGLGLVGGTIYLGRDWDDDELADHPDVPNGWGPVLWWDRVRARYGETLTAYQEPAFNKLLPDPDPSFARPYTLCLSLEDMLVHSEWTREHGWRVAKRPGVDYFLHYLSQYYEIVVFTSVPMFMAEPVLRKLDPYHFIMWPLTREATKYKDGELVKDLSYLNRDLSKVIMIDTKPNHVREQPENAIILPKWTGDAKDTTLVSLVPFLEFIHTMEYSDVRKVLKSFEGHDIPTEFARREAIARAEHNKRLEAMRGKKKDSPSGLGWLSSALGLKPSNMSLMVPPEGQESPQEALAHGKMLQDIAREHGIRQYMAIEEEIRKNGEKWLKEEQAEQERAQKEMMKTMTGSFSGWFNKTPDQSQQPASSTAPPPPPPSDATPEKSG